MVRVQSWIYLLFLSTVRWYVLLELLYWGLLGRWRTISTRIKIEMLGLLLESEMKIRKEKKKLNTEIDCIAVMRSNKHNLFKPRDKKKKRKNKCKSHLGIEHSRLNARSPNAIHNQNKK